MGAAVSLKRTSSFDQHLVHNDVVVGPSQSTTSINGPRSNLQKGRESMVRAGTFMFGNSKAGTSRVSHAKILADRLQLPEVMQTAVERVVEETQARDGTIVSLDPLCSDQQLAALTHDDIDKLCKEACDILGERIRQLMRTLKPEPSPQKNLDVHKSTNTANEKFGIKAGTFGMTSMFYEGLDRRIGLPQPKVLEAMEREHKGHPAAEEEFTTYNYGGTRTTIAQEWEFVVSPDLNKKYPGGRSPRKLEQFLEHEYAVKAGLRFEEVIALRLFTGPAYMKYNAELRRECPVDDRHFVTTIHAIASGVNKLMRIWKLPEDRKVFRGLSGMELPAQFWNPDEFSCRGGVELSLMSCTPKKEIALQYANATSARPTLFEIDVGQVDKGAVMSWLSQYPEEEEVLLPPLSNLEVQGHPKTETIPGCGEVLVVKLRLNVNLKALTLEEVEAKRKHGHLTMINNLSSEARLTLQATTDSELQAFAERGVAPSSFLKELDQMRIICQERPVSWYNLDDQFRKAVNEALDVKVGIERKFLSLLDLVQCSRTNSHSTLCRFDDSAGLTQRILSTPAHKFCRPGIMFELRSSTESIPWDALADSKLLELLIPSSISSEQAEIVWECLIGHQNSVKSIKIEAGQDKNCPIELSSILNQDSHSLKGYSIGSNGIKVLLPAFSFNPRIVKLDLGGCEIGDEGTRYLAILTEKRGDSFQHLNLVHNRMTDVGMIHICESLAKHSSLTYLHAGSNWLTADSGPGLRSVFDSHTSLTQIDLSWSFAADGVPEWSQPLTKLTGLTELDLSHNRDCLPGERMRILCNALTPCTGLTSLHVSMGGLGDDGVLILSEFLSTRNPKMVPLVDFGCTDKGSRALVETLGSVKLALAKGDIGMTSEVMQVWTEKLRSNPKNGLMGVNFGEFPDLNDAASASVFDLAELPSLKDFTVTIMDFSRPQVHQHISSLRFSPSLTRVSMVSCSLQAEGAKALAHALSEVRELTALELSSNYIGLEGCEALEPVLLVNTSLQALMMHYNNLGDEGMLCLGRALRNCSKLEKIGLSFNHVHRGVLVVQEILQNSPSMKVVSLQGNSLGTIGVHLLVNCGDLISKLHSLDLSLSGMSPFIAMRIAQRWGGNISMIV